MKKYIYTFLTCIIIGLSVGCSTTKTTTNPTTGTEVFDLPLNKLYLPKVKYD